MTDDDAKPGGVRFSLSRWSERKRASARGEPLPGSAPADAPASVVAPARAVRPASAANTQAAASPPAAVSSDAPLPPVDSLTFDSDFTVFMSADVDEAVKRSALRKLLRDPRFNVMDGLDTYIDDYSLPDPIAPSMLAQLRHSVATLNPVFDHPQAGAASIEPAADPALPPAAAPVPALEAALPAHAADAALAPACDDAHRASRIPREQAAELAARASDEPSCPQSAPAPAGPIGNRSGA